MLYTTTLLASAVLGAPARRAPAACDAACETEFVGRCVPHKESRGTALADAVAGCLAELDAGRGPLTRHCAAGCTPTGAMMAGGAAGDGSTAAPDPTAGPTAQVPPSGLATNAVGQPQGMATAEVCGGRTNCDVKLDVPPQCAGETSACPLVFNFHGRGGQNRVSPEFSEACHELGAICISPLGELYHGTTGWNDGEMQYPGCEEGEYSAGSPFAEHCAPNPAYDEGAFAARMIGFLRGRGAAGNVYSAGNSNGAANSQRLGANAGIGGLADLRGIGPSVTQMLAAPEQSGQGVYRRNRPQPGGQPVAVISFAGTEDTQFYAGGPRFGSEDFILQNDDDSNQAWADHNGCEKLPSTEILAAAGAGTEHAVRRTWNCPAGGAVVQYSMVGGGHGVGGATVTLPGRGAVSVNRLKLEFFVANDAQLAAASGATQGTGDITAASPASTSGAAAGASPSAAVTMAIAALTQVLSTGGICDEVKGADMTLEACKRQEVPNVEQLALICEVCALLVGSGGWA